MDVDAQTQWPRAARTAVAVLLLTLGLGVAFVPADVPGFAEPSGGMHDMDSDDGADMPMAP